MQAKDEGGYGCHRFVAPKPPRDDAHKGAVQQMERQSREMPLHGAFTSHGFQHLVVDGAERAKAAIAAWPAEGGDKCGPGKRGAGENNVVVAEKGVGQVAGKGPLK